MQIIMAYNYMTLIHTHSENIENIGQSENIRKQKENRKFSVIFKPEDTSILIGICLLKL